MGKVMNSANQELLSQGTNGSGAPEFRVAIIGGGPGGLFTAWHLADRLGAACKVTIYEATHRLGGKILTGKFPGVGSYEIGAAENLRLFRARI